ncbi:MAG: MobA/MobL family protein [Defluviitaleaceae bacterium]|nr:MobA/MobL family protein [Defluviitaleaceae bacterium]
MAMYRCSVSIIKRSSGRSSVAAAAYRAGGKIRNERDGKLHDYSRKQGVVYTEIILPSYAPESYKDRAILWNAVEKCERRIDSQTAREVQIALPIEFSLDENIKVLREYINENFVDKGMCADYAIHDTGNANPHAHIMLTMRDVSQEGFGNKNRTWNNKNQLEQWRENWANVCNNALKEKGEQARIDHRSLESQGLEREPTIHVGRSIHRQMRNNEIIKINERFKPVAVAQYMNELEEGYNILENHIVTSKHEQSSQRRELQDITTRAKEIHSRSQDLCKQHGDMHKAIAIRDNMGYFQSKKDINKKIERLEENYKHSYDYFERSYSISPNMVNDELVRLKNKYNDVANRIHGQADLSLYDEQLRIFEMEYKRQRILAEIRADRDEILSKVRKDSRLNRVTQDDYMEIIPKLRPSQTDILAERYNHIKAKKISREFYDFVR